ncbi:Phophatidylserine decarboxylase-domain-containing protein [Aspergillus granulosus]|uniref:Phophatidylserine decarboxylase-domain-containing protein n=1 Tax=Aspergillus granulosus TaxID=176169 RepID=A0ABR4HD16_9EURO
MDAPRLCPLRRAGVIAHVDSKAVPKIHPVLKEGQNLIETNTHSHLLFSAMFEEIPRNQRYRTDPTGSSEIRDYSHMLCVLDYLLITAPPWNDFLLRVSLIGLPINAVFDWSMGTPSGYAAYLDPDINAVLKKILNNTWGASLNRQNRPKCWMNQRMAGSGRPANIIC